MKRLYILFILLSLSAAIFTSCNDTIQNEDVLKKDFGKIHRDTVQTKTVKPEQ